MPYEIIKRSDDCYEVRNKLTKKIFAYCTTKSKAGKLIRLLHMKNSIKK